MEDPLRRDRKYKLTWAVFLMATFMLAIDKLDGDMWVTVIMGIMAAYMAGNVGEHIAKRGQD